MTKFISRRWIGVTALFAATVAAGAVLGPIQILEAQHVGSPDRSVVSPLVDKRAETTAKLELAQYLSPVFVLVSVADNAFWV